MLYCYASLKTVLHVKHLQYETTDYIALSLLRLIFNFYTVIQNCAVYNSFYLCSSIIAFYSFLPLRCPTSFQAVVEVCITVIFVLKLCYSGNSFNVKRFRCLNFTEVQFFKLLYCYTKLCYAYNSFNLHTFLLDYNTCWNDHT